MSQIYLMKKNGSVVLYDANMIETVKIKSPAPLASAAQSGGDPSLITNCL